MIGVQPGGERQLQKYASKNSKFLNHKLLLKCMFKPTVIGCTILFSIVPYSVDATYDDETQVQSRFTALAVLELVFLL